MTQVPPKSVNRSVLAGLAAAWVKARSERPLQAAAELVLPPSPAQKREVGADPSGHPENMPPAVVIGRVAAKLGYPGLPVAQRLRVQRLVHYGFGSGLGLAYAVFARQRKAGGTVDGALVGLAVYLATHGSLLPALRIQRPPWRLAPAAVTWEAGSHVIWGAALARIGLMLGAWR